MNPSFICSSSTALSNSVIEKEYEAIQIEIKSHDTLVIDLRTKDWYDLWALIQLLFIIEQIKAEGKTPWIYISNPLLEADEVKRRGLYWLQELQHLRFFENVEAVGGILWFQRGGGERLSPISALDLTDFIDHVKNTYPVNLINRVVIPFQQIEGLNWKSLQEELFKDSEDRFGPYAREAIVEQGGVGDCFVTELVENAVLHGVAPNKHSCKGYIALRCNASMKFDKENDPVKYRKRVYRRTEHELSDWQEFHRTYIDDEFFELIVVDKGDGIAKSILADPKIPKELVNGTDAKSVHERLRYALGPLSSRLSPKEREERDLPEFTGLSAICGLVGENEGAILIRESMSRHIFWPASDGMGDWSIFVRRRSGSENKIRLPEIKGLSVSVLVPMKYAERELLGSKNIRASRNWPKRTDVSQSVRVFFANGQEEVSIGGVAVRNRWAGLGKRVAKVDNNVELIVVDVSEANPEKNILWPALRRLLRQTTTRKCGLILSGVTARLASRIMSYSELDSKRILGGNDWLLYGISDDSTVYCFGEFGKNRAERSKLIGIYLDAFIDQRQVRDDLMKVIDGMYYWRRSKESDDMSGVRLGFSPDVIMDALMSKLLEPAHDVIQKNREAWFFGKKVKLVSGQVVRNYLDIRAIRQLMNIGSDIIRSLRIRASQVEFDGLLSVGPVTHTIAGDIADSLLRRKLPSGKRMHMEYYDYSSLDFGESSKVSDRPIRILLLLDGIRSGRHCVYAIEHVKSLGLDIAGIMAIFDLSEKGWDDTIEGFQIKTLMSFPVITLDPSTSFDLEEDLFTHRLIGQNASSLEALPVKWNKRMSYSLLEGSNAIHEGHSTFVDQHFGRTVLLPHVFSNTNKLNSTLIHELDSLLQNEKIDCVVYPEVSSVSYLVKKMVTGTTRVRTRAINAVMCNATVFPDGSSGYDIDSVGKASIESASRILILEDEVYTGKSIRNLVSICKRFGEQSLKKLIVFVVIDSLVKAERGILATLLGFEESSKNVRADLYDFEFRSFMRLSLQPYWNENDCPYCQWRRRFEQIEATSVEIIEKTYAKMRALELTARRVDQLYEGRASMEAISALELSRPGCKDPVKIRTMAGLLLYCEEAILEGDFQWVLQRISPGNDPRFPQEAIFLLIEALSRKIQILLRLGLLSQFTDKVIEYISSPYSPSGLSLSKLLEIVSTWPLYLLNTIWTTLSEILVMENNPQRARAFLPGLSLLLDEITGRRSSQISTKLLTEFDESLAKKIHSTPHSSEYFDTQVVIHLLMSARRRQTKGFDSLSKHLVDASFILSYYLESANHQILHRTLLNVKDSDSPQLEQYLTPIQLLSQLAYSLERICILDKQGLNNYENLESYKQLQNNVLDLRRAVEGGGELATSIVKGLVNDVLRLLFHEGSDLRIELTKYFEKHRLSMNEVEKELISWAALNQSDVKRNGVDGGPNFVVAMNASAREQIFSEILINLGKALSSWRANKSPAIGQQSLGLFAERFTVKYSIDVVLDKLYLRIENPFAQVFSSGSGVGMTQIHQAAERLGIKYESWIDGDRKMFIQKINLWRFVE